MTTGTNAVDVISLRAVALGVGAEAALLDRGGLRARILTDGGLGVDA